MHSQAGTAPGRTRRQLTVPPSDVGAAWHGGPTAAAFESTRDRDGDVTPWRANRATQHGIAGVATMDARHVTGDGGGGAHTGSVGSEGASLPPLKLSRKMLCCRESLRVPRAEPCGAAGALASVLP